MAVTNLKHIGLIRINLANLLNKQISKLNILPENLNSNNPIYASKIYDHCSWYAITNSKLPVHLYSFSTMQQCVKMGFFVRYEDEFNIEIISKGLDNEICNNH
jgi:hypothetical protein